MKLYDVIKLDFIYSKLKVQELSTQLRYKVVGLLFPIHTEAESCKKELLDLVEIYGARDDSGALLKDENGNVVYSSDKFEEFSIKLLETMEKKINIQLPKIDFSIEDFESLDLTCEEFEYLLPFIFDTSLASL